MSALLRGVAQGEASGWVSSLTESAAQRTSTGSSIRAISRLNSSPPPSHNLRALLTWLSIGYHSVFDPGPPPLDYKCNTNANNVDGAPGGLCANFHLPVQTSSVAAGAEPAHTSTWQSAMLTTQSGPPPKPTASTGVPVAAETDPLSPDSPGASNPASPLDAGTKVAIGISSGLGFLLVACLALFLLRRRHHKRRDCNPPSSVKNRIRYPCDFPPPGSSMTPLIPSPTTTREPLTPPLRLRDRRFLPSILRQSRSPSPPLTPLDPVNLPPHAAAAFPSSPICSPTINRLVPRHERTPKFYQYSSTPPSSPSFLPPLPPPPAYFHDHDRGSLGSTSTFAPSTKSTTSTGVGPSNSLSSLRNDTVSLLSLPPLPPPPPAPNPPQHQTSPTRPPRPHETPLVIPDLVSPTSPAASTTSPGVVSPPTSPAGPPPNRALPACPVQTPAIVVEGASPGPSPGGAGEVSGRGWGGQKIGGRELGESRG